jgi:hypothetical protein
MAYSRAKLKSGDDKAYAHSKPFWIGKLLDRCVPIWTLQYDSFKQIRLTNLMGIQTL